MVQQLTETLIPKFAQNIIFLMFYYAATIRGRQLLRSQLLTSKIQYVQQGVLRT